MNHGNTYGKGSVFQDGKTKRWIGEYSTGKNAEGKTIRKRVYGKTKSEVKKKLTEIELQIFSGEYIDKNYVTIKALATQIIEEDHALNYVKDGAYVRNVNTLKAMSSISGLSIQDIKVEQITNYFKSIQHLSQSTIDKSYHLLKRTFREAKNKNLITKSVMDDIKKPKSQKPPRKIRALTTTEQQKLWTILNVEKVLYKNQMMLSMLTGMRVGEINALHVEDIDFKNGYIYVSKTTSRDISGRATVSDTTKTITGIRDIHINDDVKQILQECIGTKKKGLVFTNKKGGLVSTNSVNSSFRRLKNKHDFVEPTVKGDIDLHSLRHTFATRCIEAGVTPVVLQKILGHKNINITLNVYSDVFDKMEQKNLMLANNYISTLGITFSKDKIAKDKAS